METLVEFTHPLFDQMRRAQHSHALDFAAVIQLSGDQRGLDGFADADVIGNQQPHRVQPQRHQQWHELVGARLDRNVAEAAERAGTATQRHAQGVGEEDRVVLAAFLRGIGQREPGGADIGLEPGVDHGTFILATG